MARAEKIYYMAPSCEIERPQIWETGYFNEWLELDQEFPAGLDCVTCTELKTFQVRDISALQWDWYGQVGMWGMWSQRAKDLLWPFTNGCLRCFRTSLNGAPYYILRVDSELATDCLDRERSDIQYFESSGRVMQVKKFVFHEGRISDPLIFHVPEIRDILCTRSVKSIVEDAGLKGFFFQDVEHLNR